jgi:hypothetical protein
MTDAIIEQVLSGRARCDAISFGARLRLYVSERQANIGQQLQQAIQGLTRLPAARVCVGRGARNVTAQRHQRDKPRGAHAATSERNAETGEASACSARIAAMCPSIAAS